MPIYAAPTGASFATLLGGILANLAQNQDCVKLRARVTAVSRVTQEWIGGDCFVTQTGNIPNNLDMKDEAAKANYQLSEFPPTLSSAKTSYQTTGILCKLRPPDLHSGD